MWDISMKCFDFLECTTWHIIILPFRENTLTLEGMVYNNEKHNPSYTAVQINEYSAVHSASSWRQCTVHRASSIGQCSMQCKDNVLSWMWSVLNVQSKGSDKGGSSSRCLCSTPAFCSLLRSDGAFLQPDSGALCSRKTLVHCALTGAQCAVSQMALLHQVGASPV